MMTEYAPADCLPHAGNMVLLDRIDVVDAETAVASLTVRADGLFNQGQSVPAWVGIEYMAQTVAAYAACQNRGSGQPPKLGFLLGTRRYHCDVDAFPVGSRLIIRSKLLLKDDNGLAVFECAIEGPGFSATANLNVFQPNNIEAYLREHG